MAAAVHPGNTGRLALLVDEVTGMQFLVDTGAVFSASGTHVGAVLHQKDKAGTRPLGFFSAKLDTAQQKYSAFDRELLALYLGIRHFRWLLEGRCFYVLTDHKPLTFALNRISDHWSARQQ